MGRQKFTDWKDSYNARHPDELYPEDILLCDCPSDFHYGFHYTPRGLLNAVFYLNGKNFALRGGMEHRSLKLSQIKRNISPEGKFATLTQKTVQKTGEVVSIS